MTLFLILISIVFFAACYAFHQQQRQLRQPGIYFIGALFDLIDANIHKQGTSMISSIITQENPKIARRLKNRSDKMLNTEKVPSTKNSSSYKQTKDNSKQVTQEKEAKQDGYESNKKNGYESDVEDLSEWRNKLPKYPLYRKAVTIPSKRYPKKKALIFVKPKRGESSQRTSFRKSLYDKSSMSKP